MGILRNEFTPPFCTSGIIKVLGWCIRDAYKITKCDAAPLDPNQAPLILAAVHTTMIGPLRARQPRPIYYANHIATDVFHWWAVKIKKYRDPSGDPGMVESMVIQRRNNIPIFRQEQMQAMLRQWTIGQEIAGYCDGVLREEI